MVKIQDGIPLLSLRIHLVGYLVSKCGGSRSKCPVDTADQWSEGALSLSLSLSLSRDRLAFIFLV